MPGGESSRNRVTEVVYMRQEGLRHCLEVMEPSLDINMPWETQILFWYSVIDCILVPDPLPNTQ
jgi:hypothetical protein